jgi:hypothetical protein
MIFGTVALWGIPASPLANASPGAPSARLLGANPTISLVPSQGPVGSAFNVTGSGFTDSGLANVTFNGTALTPIGGSDCAVLSNPFPTDVNGMFSCEFRTPSFAPGTYDVNGTDLATLAQSNTGQFDLTMSEIVSTPGQGPVGARVTITGSGFSVSSNLSLLMFGPSSLTQCSAGSLRTTSLGVFSCTVAVPGGGPGTAVTATDAGGQVATTTFNVTVPAILVTPAQGAVGSPVMVQGSGFSVSSNLSSLVFDGVGVSNCTAGNVTTNTTGAFSCGFAVPANTTGTIVTATDAGGALANASFTIAGLSLTLTPGQGPLGSQYTALGSGFTPNSGALVVFDGVDATPSVCAVGTFLGTAITTDAAGNFSCTFSITTSVVGPHNVTATDVATGGITRNETFTVTAPSITLTPAQGAIASPVVLTGTGFSVAQPIASLIFGGVAVSSCPINGSLITGSTGAFSCGFLVPAGTTGTSVIATDSGGQVASASFTLTTLSIALSPGLGPVGSALSVVGSGFTVSSGATVTFATDPAMSPSSCSIGTYSGSSITTTAKGFFRCIFVVPNIAPGTYPVTGTNLATGATVSSPGFMVTALSLVVTPGQGPAGAPVNVSGNGFSVLSSLGSLRFDGVTIPRCISGALTSSATGAFTCGLLVPGATSGSTVTATDYGGQVATTGFSVTTPMIALVPADGSVGGPFTVNGSGFAVETNVAVTFAGADLAPTACSAGVLNGTTITTNGTGQFSCAFVLPPETGGTGIVSAVQGAYIVNAVFLVTPSVSLSLGSGAVGGMVNISGGGFRPGDPFRVDWNASTTLCSGTTTASGGFACSYAVPMATAGSHTISVVQGAVTIARVFSVVPSVAASPSSGPVGTSVTLSGAGFDADSGFLAQWNPTTTLCAGTTNALGAFRCTFVVPSAPAGTSTVTVSEGTYTPGVAFTVAASPSQPRSGLAGFPWWIVGVTGIIVALLLVGELVHEGRRRRGKSAATTPAARAASATAEPLSDGAAPSTTVSSETDSGPTMPP